MNNNIIYRSADTLSADAESRRISGYAVVFDSWSRDLGGFVEKINRSAITPELLSKSDIVMNINHDDDKMLARYRDGSGTLQLELRENGLFFSFDAPETNLGDEMLWNVRNGNLFECSFAFSLDANDDKCQRWYRDADNTLKREINAIANLYDCSIVNHAAYPATSVANRDGAAESAEIVERAKQIDAELDMLENEINTL